jgi:hypothetical protein
MGLGVDVPLASSSTGSRAVRRGLPGWLFKPAAVSAQHWCEAYLAATDQAVKRDAYRRMIAALLALDESGGVR